MKGLAIFALGQYYRSRPEYQPQNIEDTLIQFSFFVATIAIAWLTLFLMIHSKITRVEADQ